jgi:hypothetical protein
MAQWPAGLANVNTPLAALNHVLTDGAIRTEMDTGAARQRRRFSGVPRQTPITMSMTTLEYRIFEAWWKHELNGGTSWFTRKWPTSAGVVALQMRFVGPYSDKLIGENAWNIDVKVEIRSVPVMSAAALAAYL